MPQASLQSARHPTVKALHSVLGAAQTQCYYQSSRHQIVQITRCSPPYPEADESTARCTKSQPGICMCKTMHMAPRVTCIYQERQ